MNAHIRGKVRRANDHRLRALLKSRWFEQRGRCIWCGSWCDLGSVTQERETINRLFLELNREPTPYEVHNKRASVEHIVPRSWGGGDEPGNIVCACVGCNTMRSDIAHFYKAKRDVAMGLPKRVRKLVLTCAVK